jgi:hypothetical protein
VDLHNTESDPDSVFYFNRTWIRLFFLMRIRILQIKAQTLEKSAHIGYIPYTLVCHLQIDADSDPYPAYHFDADPDPDFYLMQIQIRIFI